MDDIVESLLRKSVVLNASFILEFFGKCSMEKVRCQPPLNEKLPFNWFAQGPDAGNIHWN